MTQAFNLAQLANNLNTSGQLDATDGLNGLVANANLASSGTASSSTFLRGDRTWASAGLQAATTAEAQAWTSNTVAITPLALANAFKGSNQSLVGTPGYQKLPGGLIMQWGNGAGSATISFAFTFPTAVLNLVCIAQVVTGGTGAGGGTVINSLNTSNFSVDTAYGSGSKPNLYYIALGY